MEEIEGWVIEYFGRVPKKGKFSLLDRRCYHILPYFMLGDIASELEMYLNSGRVTEQNHKKFTMIIYNLYRAAADQCDCDHEKVHLYRNAARASLSVNSKKSAKFWITNQVDALNCALRFDTQLASFIGIEILNSNYNKYIVMIRNSMLNILR